MQYRFHYIYVVHTDLFTDTFWASGRLEGQRLKFSPKALVLSRTSPQSSGEWLLEARLLGSIILPLIFQTVASSSQPTTWNTGRLLCQVQG